MLGLLLLWAALATVAAGGFIQAEFYGPIPASDFQPTGMSLSGGGSRSFICSLGAFRGLHLLKVLPKVDYASSVSGGSWATAAFSYRDAKLATVEEFLGEYVAPHRLGRVELRLPIPKTCALGFPVRLNLIMVLVKEIAQSRLEDVWTRSIHQVFLRPAGISLTALPTLNNQTRAQVLARNPSLLNQVELLRVNPNQPIPILNIALLGLSEDPDVAERNNRQYVMMHFTPTHVGLFQEQNLSYANNVAALRLGGGTIDPLGFGAQVPPQTVCGLQRCPVPQVKPLPRPQHWFSIANATGASSWAPGSLLVSYQHPAELLRLQTILLTCHYLSPKFAELGSREVYVGDGENVENQGLIALLQLRARLVFMFINTATPLTSTKLDSMMGVKIGRDVDTSFAALFGYFTSSTSATEDYSRDQVFARKDLLVVMQRLQLEAAKGNGAVTLYELETVENKWWGVPRGHKVRVVFNYLSRAFAWERALPTHTWQAFGLEEERTDVLPSNGTFKRFPNLPISHPEG
ncbi:hypothetical protein BASA81_015587 [Batrachochytrium salamandrivorans]|nr:hypothetical protein BASA81_015587 [Batrachochytrium salamandrivorans]